MSTLLKALTVVAVCTLTLLPPSAAAQDLGTLPMPLAEVSAGYTYMRDVTNDNPRDIDFPAGWYASLGVNPTQWLGIVGEATGSYRDNFDVSVSDLTFSNNARVYTFMGGPRFYYKAGRIVPFAQVLAGVAHLRVKTHYPRELAEFVTTTNITSTDLAVQPGGGVTVLLTERVGVRLAADYRTIIDWEDGETAYAHEFRLMSGFTLHWGGR